VYGSYGCVSCIGESIGAMAKSFVGMQRFASLEKDHSPAVGADDTGGNPSAPCVAAIT
jgi:hypothetical protein